MFKRIDHVEILPRDLEQTISFYTEILGFKLKERVKVKMPPLEEVVFITLNDTMIEILYMPNPPLPASPWEVGCKSIALEVEDMGKTVEFLKSKGVAITRGPNTLGNGSIRAEIKDPSGMTIELRQWKK